MNEIYNLIKSNRNYSKLPVLMNVQMIAAWHLTEGRQIRYSVFSRFSI